MNFPKLTDITGAWVQALQTDAALGAFAEAELGKLPVLFDGSDSRHPPSVEDCPWIAIEGLADSTGLENARPSYTLVVVCCVSAEEAGRTPAGNDGRVVVYPAIGQVEELAALVLDALSRTPYLPQTVEGELFPDAYPLVMKGLEITTATDAVLDGSRDW